MAEVSVGVLGPMTATVAGRPVSLGGPRQRAVLAVLVAARGGAVSEDRILHEAWGEDAAVATGTLHAYVSMLRRVLEPGRPAGAPAKVLVREGNGYRLSADRVQVDAETFTDLAARAERAMREGRHPAAAGLLTEALALWRGEVHEALPLSERARLEAVRQAATENLYETRLALGDHAALVGDLDKHTRTHPLSERGWELLALALYRSGRQADALAALREVRDILGREVGLDPGPSLRRLEAAILAQHAEIAPQEPAPPRAGNLPNPLSRFVGRPGEPARIGALVSEHRLVTLTGPGGVGKTRLALESARERSDTDGPWLVELAGLEDPAALPAALAGALGILGAATVDRLAEVLGGREILLVLDNAEHLLQAVRQAVRTLAGRTPGVRILVTSREPLGLPGEVVYEVRPLPAEQGHELFLARAATSVPDWTPGAAEDRLIRRLCYDLDGLPLAIELAAAQCRVLSLEQIAGELDDRLTVLHNGAEPGRHQTLWRTVEWSHAMLTGGEREVFHRLSVFASPFDLEAAAAVCGRPVFAELSALVRKSLVSVEAGTDPRRYRLLETIKLFARSRIDAGARAAHRAWVLAEAEAAAPHLRDHLAGDHLARLHARLPEHRLAFASAVQEGDGDYVVRLVGLLHWVWYRHGVVAEGLSWVATALELGRERLGPVHLARSGLCYLAGDFATAAEASRRAAEAGETQAFVHGPLFEALSGAPGALERSRSALTRARRTGVRWLEAEALMVLGMLLRMAGNTGTARQRLAQAATIAQDCGHGFVRASVDWMIMKIDLESGDHHSTVDRGAAMLAGLDGEGDVTSWLVGVHCMAAAVAVAGDPTRGAMLLGAATELGSRIGFSPEEMDPVDAPHQAALVRAALPDGSFDHWFQRGRSLSRSEVRALVAIGAHNTS
ncbi:BTAD domain-containing putative transcriptional regulator [Nonomuraea sediminis]|uniref:BTAD domain-containing putative transcriptional regulator n=1 Tax=Nonomuraea sediminis TaxID=2835864 RepID=UPI001BDBBB66|nr:BTAD domain-containing putative transcriptional regulator [Nonomuraea sediminis]